MVIPVGSFINCATIILGSSLGLVLGNRMTPNIRAIVFQGLGLCVAILGIEMALQTGNPLILIFSVLLGSIIGEMLNIEAALDFAGNSLKNIFKSNSGTFTQAFVSATMLFAIGSMAILGPLEEGLSGERSILLTKSMLDGFTSMALAAALGPGVLFSAIPVFILQGSITVLAVYLQVVLSPTAINELKAAGGILIIGIGLNMLEITKIKLSNMLPALVCAVIIVAILGALPEFTLP